MKGRKMALKDTQRVYDTYITLQKKVESTGPFDPLEDYEDYISLWAESRFLRGKNFYAARAANSKTDVEFIIRNRNDLDPTMRIKIKKEGTDDKYDFYDIEGILPLDNDRMFLTIKAYKVERDM